MFDYYSWINILWPIIHQKLTAPAPEKEHESTHLHNISFFHQVFLNIFDITYINSLMSNKKIVHLSIQSSFFQFIISCKTF